jgi:hypothetical protein
LGVKNQTSRPLRLRDLLPHCGLEAQREIADNQLIRIQQFLVGERDFEDAIVTDEFVLPVEVWPDGSISIEGGRIYGKIE